MWRQGGAAASPQTQTKPTDRGHDLSDIPPGQSTHNTHSILAWATGLQAVTHPPNKPWAPLQEIQSLWLLNISILLEKAQLEKLPLSLLS